MRWLGLLLPLLLTGCLSPGYLWQASQGQWQLMTQARPVAELLADAQTDAPLKQRLAMSQRIRQFAKQQLLLPSEASYATYVALDRPYVVWSVTAAPPLGLTPKQWCFPVVGCLSYRGYFSAQGAEDFARELRAEGWDVAVSPVAAYSTLGWFSDPLLSTTLFWPPGELAHLLFHELAHQRLYIAGDTAFNESYAEWVAQQGVRSWLAQQGSPAAAQRYQQHQEGRQQFEQRLLELRAQLQGLYESTLSETAKGYQKRQALARFRYDYAQRKKELGLNYDAWVYKDLNNARLALLGLYRQWLPAFARLFAQAEGDWARFHAAAAALGQLPYAQRQQALQQLNGSHDG
ncbi:aminopeptidase [Magnetococcus marinus]|nr:aminopeptidase [Magnetococcus marinus]